ncbi:tRNA lysidine(34) synthetase TilS [Altererythrobacter sp. ZODW24]|uniref:tRNA lysidine(34) synthetase TilS n=1 Tax=Altererythrobacter sp. ZODW24 TaxID=2185142 RepID=UPI000DF76377|nr:tRNA lysidine(34) synthetase TilS [Altererythrobacter sp. ZODW24]
MPLRLQRSAAIDRALDPELTNRFRSDLERIWKAGGKLGLAVSGGPDSMALLLLAHGAIPDAIEVATVDHGLRSEAAGEAEMVADLCAELGVEHRILTVEVAEGNLQDEARKARYHALAGWMVERGLSALATGHHADDQAETVLMRMNRGSGVAGLAGIRSIGRVLDTDLPLVRPLLDWRRSELAEICQAAGVTPAADPSNQDDGFDRVRIRKALQDAEWIDAGSLAASARHMADADEALNWAADTEWQDCVERSAETLIYRPVAPYAIRLRVIARIFASFGTTPRGGSVARLMDALERGKGASLGGVVATARRGLWNFRAEEGRKS